MLPLHEEVRRARKELKLSQQELAKMAGVQRRQLSTLENDGNVTLTTLRKILGQLPNVQPFTLTVGGAEAVPRAASEREFEVFAKTHEALRETLEKFNAVAAAHRALVTGEDPEKAAQMAAEAESEIDGPYVEAVKDALWDECLVPGSTLAKKGEAKGMDPSARFARRRLPDPPDWILKEIEAMEEAAQMAAEAESGIGGPYVEAVGDALWDEMRGSGVDAAEGEGEGPRPPFRQRLPDPPPLDLPRDPLPERSEAEDKEK